MTQRYVGHTLCLHRADLHYIRPSPHPPMDFKGERSQGRIVAVYRNEAMTRSTAFKTGSFTNSKHFFYQMSTVGKIWRNVNSDTTKNPWMERWNSKGCAGAELPDQEWPEADLLNSQLSKVIRNSWGSRQAAGVHIIVSLCALGVLNTVTTSHCALDHCLGNTACTNVKVLHICTH